MVRRSASPPKPKSPILTVGQKRRRIERLQKCLTKLRVFDPQKARKRAPAVLELETTIDKALSSAFGYGSPAYLRYNEAATLDPSPLLTNVTVRAAVSRPAGGPVRHDAKIEETRQHFSENKARATALLQRAIQTLEEEIAKAGPEREVTNKPKSMPDVAADEKPEPKSPAMVEVHLAAPRRWAGITFEAVRHRVGRWLRRKG